MRAGMENLIEAMRGRRPAPEGAEPRSEVTQWPTNDADDGLAPALGSTATPSPLGADEAGEPRGAAAVLERGAVVGRHVVLRTLGAGGMGVVHAAYDPELDRKVALKLLRPGIGADKGRARLLREAQALARLAHPNVVAIHDVGTLGEQVWLAMEFVQGQTLTAWLRTPRSLVEVLGVMRGAGEGLAAAHAAGLLHRDFKPDNVMVGDDGRARVMDFGLARARPEREVLALDPGQPQPTVETLATPITQAGAIVGTPSYMAPEQFGDAEITAAADQFAFCVTLWQALYGERPFAGSTLMELVANVLAGRRRPPPKGRRVPSGLRRACERGLSFDPRDRWPSMDALLSELRRLSAPRRRGRWALGLVVGAVAVGAGLARYAEVGFRCKGAEAQLEGVWDQARKQEVKEAILGTGSSYAPDTWVRVEQRLDEYADAWAAKHAEVCVATSIRKEQSPEVMDLRMECLRGRRVALREAVGLLAGADAGRAEKAVALVAGLPGLSRCDDVETLRADLPPPEDPRVAEEVEALRDRLRTVSALWDVEATAQALDEVARVEARARALGYEPLLAEVLLWRGRLRDRSGLLADAEQDLGQAYRLALRHAHGEVELDAAVDLLAVVGTQRGYDAAQRWLEEARERAHRHGTSARARAWMFNNIGILLARRGELEQAQDSIERALVTKQEALGARHPDVAISAMNLGKVLSLRGHDDEALRAHRLALSIQEEALGPRHPNVAVSLQEVGILLQGQGELAEALALHQRALSIREAALGPRHAAVAESLFDIGIVLERQGTRGAALEALRRASSIMEEARGPRHPDVAAVLSNIGLLLQRQGQTEAALELQRRALSIREEAQGPRHPDVAATLSNIGVVLRDQGKLEEALEVLRRALSIVEEAQGPRDVSLAAPLINIGVVLRDQGKLEEALELQRRALSIREEALGPRHPDIASSLDNIGILLRRQGKLEEALDFQRRALSIREEALGPRHPDVANLLDNLGAVLRLQGELEEALGLHQRALSVREEALGPHHPTVSGTLLDLAEVALDQHDHVGAREHAERALAIREASPTSPRGIAQARFLLARSLWPDPPQRPRARALAERARDGFEALGEVGREPLAEVRAWLTERERG